MSSPFSILFEKEPVIILEKEVELKELQNSLFIENEAISKIKGSQEGILTEWKQAGLEGQQPNLEALRIRHQIVSKSIEEMDEIGGLAK